MKDQDTQKYINHTMKGSEFCELFPNLSQKLIKLTKSDEFHNGLQYKTGYNEDFLDFKPMGTCESGGIYITDEDNMLQWLRYGDKDMKYCRKVEFCNNSSIYIEKDNKFKVDRLMLGERVEIKDLPCWRDEEYCLNAMSSINIPFGYFRENDIYISIKKMIEAVERNPEKIASLLYVGMKVPESVQLAAVQKKGSLIKYLTKYNDALGYVIVSSVDKDSGENVCYLLKRNPYDSDKDKNRMREEEKEKDPMGRIVNYAASEKVQLAAVKQDGLAIEYLVCNFRQVSFEVRLEAVKQNGLALHFIIEPRPSMTVLDTPEEIIMAAIIQNPESIYYLAHAKLSISEDAKLAAVKQNGDIIEYLIEGGVSKEVQLEAIKQKAYSVIHLLRGGYLISEELQLAIVEKDYLCIFSILRENIKYRKNYISEKVWLEFIKKCPEGIEYIANEGYPLTKKIQLEAVKQNGLLIKTILKYDHNISEDVKLEAVKQKGSAIKYLIGKGEISEEVKLEAVKQNGHNILFLYLCGIEVSEDVKLAAVKQDFMAIHYILSDRGEASNDIKMAALEKSGLDNYFSLLNFLDQNGEKFRLIFQTAEIDLWSAVEK